MEDNIQSTIQDTQADLVAAPIAEAVSNAAANDATVNPVNPATAATNTDSDSASPTTSTTTPADPATVTPRKLSDEVTEIEPGVFQRRPKGSKYIIEYRRDMCIGAASCAAIAGFTFGMDAENKAVLLGANSKSDSGMTIGNLVDEDDVILTAAQSCPVFAIIIKDAETGEQIFPMIEED